MRLLLFVSRTNYYGLHLYLKRFSCYDGVRRETLDTIHHVIITPTSKVLKGLRYDHSLHFGVKNVFKLTNRFHFAVRHVCTLITHRRRQNVVRTKKYNW